MLKGCEFLNGMMFCELSMKAVVIKISDMIIKIVNSVVPLKWQ